MIFHTANAHQTGLSRGALLRGCSTAALGLAAAALNLAAAPQDLSAAAQAQYLNSHPASTQGWRPMVLDKPPAEWDANGDGHWDGFTPDVEYAFDAAGFDHRPDGTTTGWRAFAYYPFPGTFFPTNGSLTCVANWLGPLVSASTPVWLSRWL